MKLILVRHGISKQNVGDLISGGSSDPDLTEKGIENIKKISQKLDSEKVDTVYSSPLMRAYHTAQLLMPNKEIITDDRLKEMSFGSWEGQHANPLRIQYPDAFDFMGMLNDNYAKYAKNGETYGELVARCKSFIDSLKASASNKTVLAVCHGITIRGLMAASFELDTSEITNVANVGFNELIFDESSNWTPRLMSFNKTIPIMIKK